MLRLDGASSRFGFSTIRVILNAFPTAAPTPTPEKESSPAEAKSVEGSGAETQPGASEVLASTADPIERELAGRALTEEGAFQEVIALGGAMCFQSAALQELLRPWLDEGRGPRDDELQDLMAQSPLIRALIAELFPDSGKAVDTSRREARELLYRIEERRLRQRKREVHEALIQAQRSGDDPMQARLSAEWVDVNAKLNDLASKLEMRRSQAA